jgi:hypothetical protein
MPLFYLKARYGHHLIPEDGEPEEFSTVEEARQEALQEVREFAEAAASSGKPPDCESIEIMDLHGHVVLRLSVGEEELPAV